MTYFSSDSMLHFLWPVRDLRPYQVLYTVHYKKKWTVLDQCPFNQAWNQFYSLLLPTLVIGKTAQLFFVLFCFLFLFLFFVCVFLFLWKKWEWWCFTCPIRVRFIQSCIAKCCTLKLQIWYQIYVKSMYQFYFYAFQCNSVSF